MFSHKIKTFLPREPAPTLAQKAGSLASAAVGVAKDVAKGVNPIVPDNVYTERLAICTACEFWNKAALMGSGNCTVCGCGRVKHRLRSQKCPKAKWSPFNA